MPTRFQVAAVLATIGDHDGAAVSVRLEVETEKLVEAETRRTRRSKSGVVEDDGSDKALVADAQLSGAQVRVAVAYRNAYPDEIDDAIADNRRPLDALTTLFPFIEVVEA
jgi:hypothetical protein